MDTRATLRAQRHAARVENGELIFKELRRCLPDMVEAAERAMPAVSAVSAKLARKFPTEMQSTRVRQFVGLAVRAIMEDAGYYVAQQGVRISEDPLFSVGAVYKKQMQATADADDDPLTQMLTALSPFQARRAMDILSAKFPDLARTERKKR